MGTLRRTYKQTKQTEKVITEPTLSVFRCNSRWKCTNNRNYKYYSVNNHNFYSNLFVKVEELENNCFLAVWRYREFTHEVEGTQYKTRIDTFIQLISMPLKSFRCRITC